MAGDTAGQCSKILTWRYFNYQWPLTLSILRFSQLSYLFANRADTRTMAGNEMQPDVSPSLNLPKSESCCEVYIIDTTTNLVVVSLSSIAPSSAKLLTPSVARLGVYRPRTERT